MNTFSKRKKIVIWCEIHFYCFIAILFGTTIQISGKSCAFWMFKKTNSFWYTWCFVVAATKLPTSKTTKNYCAFIHARQKTNSSSGTLLSIEMSYCSGFEQGFLDHMIKFVFLFSWSINFHRPVWFICVAFSKVCQHFYKGLAKKFINTHSNIRMNQHVNFKKILNNIF